MKPKTRNKETEALAALRFSSATCYTGKVED